MDIQKKGGLNRVLLCMGYNDSAIVQAKEKPGVDLRHLLPSRRYSVPLLLIDI